MWFWKKKKKIEKLTVPEVKFVGEQDGSNERHLKDKLTVVFGRERSINRAYLAQAIYHNSNGAVEVVLALKATNQSDARIAAGVAEVLREIAPANVHLDIVFLSETMEQDLSKVCRPFYELTGGQIFA